jgi:hypothetical protein
LGELYYAQGLYAKAISSLNEALTLQLRIGGKDNIATLYNQLAKAYSAMKDFEKAYHYMMLFSVAKDSLVSVESAREIARMSGKYQFEMKELQIASLNKDNQLLIKDKTITDSELKRQRIYIYSVGSVLLLVLSLAFFIFKGYKEKQRANKLLEQKNALIEEKNKNITDSINYARRIQNSLITSERYIAKQLGRLKKSD